MSDEHDLVKGMLQELLEDNVVLIVHRDGDTTVLMNEETISNNPKQVEMSMRLLLVTDPSIVLKAVLLIESLFHYFVSKLPFKND